MRDPASDPLTERGVFQIKKEKIDQVLNGFFRIDRPISNTSYKQPETHYLLFGSIIWGVSSLLALGCGLALKNRKIAHYACRSLQFGTFAFAGCKISRYTRVTSRWKWMLA